MFDSVASTFGGYVDKVEDVLTGELHVDAATVKKIVGHLEDAQRLMPRDGDVDPVDGVAFGTLPANGEMDFHSTNARDFVMGALSEMLKALVVYDEGVLAFRDSVVGADDLSEVGLLRITAATHTGQRANRDDEERD